MRLSRPCYDKPRRCPGWAGGGMKYARETRCENGNVTVGGKHPTQRPWRFGRCRKCDVVTWPWVTRRLDPAWWAAKFSSVARRTRWAVEDWQAARTKED